ncbi:MAG: phosphoglucosamine mutase, partial [Planctomycetota bacterium]
MRRSLPCGAKSPVRELKIGTSWVRGVVGDGLTPELVVNFACAFGTWSDGGPIVIGRDPRRSSAMFRAAVVSGLLSPGCEIIDLGICPTPLVSFVVRETGASGGISITGGHNDARWNALKFLGPDGALLSAVKSEELLDIYHASTFASASRFELGRVSTGRDFSDRYVELLSSSVDVEALQRRRFRVAVDYCNGAAGPSVTKFLESLGCEVLPINETPQREFAHAPTPTQENMRELAGLVRHLEVDLGAAVNVDGDRLALVTAEGQPLSEEYTLPLAVRGRLLRRPGVVVTNLSTSRMVETTAAEFGQRVVRTTVGEGHVVDCGLDEGAVIAGEGSGGVGVFPTTMAFDAGLTLATILEAMASGGQSLASLVEELPRFHNRKGGLRCSPDRVYRALQHFRSAYSGRSPNLSDGVRIDWD